MIIMSRELLDTSTPRRNLGEGATMSVQEAQWVGRRSVYDKPTAVAVKRLKFELPDTANDLAARPRDESKHLADFTLELRALCHGAIRDHPNIVRIFILDRSLVFGLNHTGSTSRSYLG
jgi:hypothetical protein